MSAQPQDRFALHRVLDAFLDAADRPALLANDPLALVHRYRAPEDQEVAGILVAMLAYGRVATIVAKAEDALLRLGPSPALAIERDDAWRHLEGFVHRFQAGSDLARFMRGVAKMRVRWGSLGAAFTAGALASEHDYVPAMTRFVEALEECMSGEMTVGLKFLLPNPRTGGAAKRLALYLRWMVRPADGVDLGAWRRLGLDVQPRRLIVPLDTHVHRIARYVGLCSRRSADLRAAAEITEHLRALRPSDPVAYDLALCHLGISGLCPKKREASICGGCALREICKLGP